MFPTDLIGCIKTGMAFWNETGSRWQTKRMPSNWCHRRRIYLKFWLKIMIKCVMWIDKRHRNCSFWFHWDFKDKESAIVDSATKLFIQIKLYFEQMCGEQHVQRLNCCLSHWTFSLLKSLFGAHFPKTAITYFLKRPTVTSLPFLIPRSLVLFIRPVTCPSLMAHLGMTKASPPALHAPQRR